MRFAHSVTAGGAVPKRNAFADLTGSKSRSIPRAFFAAATALGRYFPLLISIEIDTGRDYRFPNTKLKTPASKLSCTPASRIFFNA